MKNKFVGSKMKTKTNLRNKKLVKALGDFYDKKSQKEKDYFKKIYKKDYGKDNAGRKEYVKGIINFVSDQPEKKKKHSEEVIKKHYAQQNTARITKEKSKGTKARKFSAEMRQRKKDATSSTKKHLEPQLLSGEENVVDKCQNNEVNHADIKIYEPVSIEDAINCLQTFLESDLWSKFKDEKIKGNVFSREDKF